MACLADMEPICATEPRRCRLLSNLEIGKTAGRHKTIREERPFIFAYMKTTQSIVGILGKPTDRQAQCMGSTLFQCYRIGSRICRFHTKHALIRLWTEL